MPNVNYANGGQGPYRTFIAWFDFGSGSINTGITPYNNTIPGVGTITLELNRPSSTTLTAQTGGGGGDLFGVGYTGVGGSPSIYLFANNTSASGTIIVQNIKIVDLNNNPINYYLITGDSETTIIQNEFLTWTTNGTAWTNYGNVSSSGGPYASTITGIGTQSVTSRVVNPGAASVSPILSSQNATQLTLAMEPHGGEGAGVGFLLSYATLKKYVDKLYSGINDTLTYTLVVTNKSISDSSGTITDNLSPYVTFIPGSVTINGTSTSQSPPSINTGNIPSGGVSTIQFKVTITSIPPNNLVTNVGTFNGSGSSGNLSATSNNVATTISFLTNTINKFVDPTLVAITDIITYTIAIKNTGNIPMPSPVILDTVPNGTRYVANSLTNATGSPNNQILLSTIPAGSTSTISFKVQVVSVPCPNPIPNDATLIYTYKIDPNSSNTLTGSGVSNTVETLVGFADLSSKKYVDANYSYLGDFITYTISIKNSGVGSTKTILFFDTLPKETIFVNNSITINNISQPGAIISPSGLNIPNLMANETLTITFQVQSTTVPVTNPILNEGYFTYTDDTPNTTKNTFTNIVSTTITSLTSIVKKYVDKTLVPLADTITYTLTVENTGNIDMLTPTIIDTLPNGVQYIEGSLTNGTGSPNSSIILQPLAPGAIATSTFKVKVITIPSPNPMINSFNLIYTFKKDPTKNAISAGSNLSNSVSTLVGFAQLSSSKYVDTNYVILNETITYTITVKNSGAGDARTVLFVDTLPDETTFIGNTFSVNNVIQPQVTNSPFIVSLPNITPNEIVTLTFKVKSNTLPEFNPISNIGYFTFTDDTVGVVKNTVTNVVSTTISMAILESKKFVDPEFANLNDTITYNIVLNNLGNIPANKLVLIDTLPSFGILIPNTITQDNEPISLLDENLIAQLKNPILPMIPSTISFKIIVLTLPTPNPLINKGELVYYYTSNPNFINSNESKTVTNPVSTLILKAEISTLKYVDKLYADCNDLITYTIVWSNSGNTTAINLFFVDTIPNGTILENYSVYLNNKLLPDVSPELGLNIPFIGPSNSATITYKVRVIC